MLNKLQQKESNILDSVWLIEVDLMRWLTFSINLYKEYSLSSKKIFKTNLGVIRVMLNIIWEQPLTDKLMENQSDYQFYQIHHIFKQLILLLWAMLKQLKILYKITIKHWVF